MAVLVLPFWHDRWALLGFVISATTHGFIDRRCPVRWLLRRTGSASFSEIQLGVLSADQAPCILPCSDGRAVSGDSMRSTRARLLRQDQLLVERDAVHKITKVDHAIPHNTVIAEVTNQVTGEGSTRTLRWDEHVTTEEPLEVKIGEIGKITVELVQLADEEDRPVYRYKITDGAAGIDHERTDLHLGPRLRPHNTFAAKALLSELRDASEAYSAGHFIEADKFPEVVNS